MLILHAHFSGGCFIWAERSFDGDGIQPSASVHPWCAPSGEIAEALRDMGVERAAGECRIDIELPTSGGLPVPSSPLLGELRTSEPKQCGLKRWVVDAVRLSVTEMLSLISAIPGDSKLTESGCLVSHGVMASLDLCCAVECARFASSLLERGRFLPDIHAEEQAGGEMQCGSVWRPLLIGEDAERFEALARVMPRALTRGADDPRVPLSEMLETIVDGAIRTSWSERHKKSPTDVREQIADAVTAENKKRGRLVSALNPHALWARSLGWLGDTEGLSVSLESIYPDVRAWWSRFEWFAKAPFKLCVSLLDEPDELGRWRLSYSLKFLTSGDTISAADVWTAEDGEVSGSYMRRYMLLLLGRIGSVVPPAQASLDAPAPDGCSLDIEQAADFLAYQAATLEGMGVNVAYPSWWRPSSIDRLTLRGRVLSGSVDPTIFAYTVWSRPNAREDKLGVAWEIALDGELVTGSELASLTEGGCPIVKIGGRWAFIHEDQLEVVRRHAASLPTSITAGEAIQLAIRDQFIDGFTDAPDLEVVYETLRRGRPRVTLGEPGGMTGKMRPYQLRGYSWMAFLTSLGFGVCLADDMGLGKTIQALALVQHHRDMGDTRPVLLVCPTSVLENWRVEMERFFPRLEPYIHHGRRRARDEKFPRAIVGASMVLTSYSLLARDASFIEKVDWLGIVLDEAQNIKNPDTHQARVARTLKAEWRAVLTGTPIENHVGDLWSIMEFLMPGMLGSRRSFRADYIKPIQEDRDRALMDALRRQVAPLIMRRMKTDREIAPELPEKIESKVYCSLKREQAQMYSEAVDAMSAELDSATGIKRKGIVLAALTKIKQICDHPELCTRDGDGSAERSAKLERLLSLAEEMTAVRGKTLIFTQYVSMGSIIKTQLQERFGREVLFLHGGVDREARTEMIDRFQASRGPQFFVLSLKAGGVGLNLTGANHVVLYDRWWNPAVEAQAIDRAHRIGQTRTVQVHVFCCRGTIEERIDAMIESKKELASGIIEAGENWVTELSDRELHKLIALSPGAAADA